MREVMTRLPGNANCVAIYRLKATVLVCFERRYFAINLSEWRYFSNLTSASSLSMRGDVTGVPRAVESRKCSKCSTRSLALLQLGQTKCKHAPALVKERCANTVLPFLETAALFSHVLSACNETGLGEM